MQTDQRHTRWTFGELPELMELQRGRERLLGYPGLVDAGQSVNLEVFDSAGKAKREHRAGLRRLFGATPSRIVCLASVLNGEATALLGQGTAHALKRGGFGGLLMSDDLGMKALTGSFRSRAEAVIAAGSDIALHCSGDLDEAKTFLTGSYALRFSSNAAIANQLLAIQQQDLGIDYVQKRNSLVEAVTLDQVKSQARRLLHPDRLIVTVVGKPEGVK